MSLLEVSGLTISYAGSARPAVDGVDLAVAAGESVGIVGETGCGKTQTALALLGLLPPGARVTGSILFDGCDLTGLDAAGLNRVRARRIAMVFQDPKQALNPYMKVGDQLRRVLLEHGMAKGRAAQARALEMLRRVRLPDPERQFHSYPHQLSGGMRQRAMIALALCCEPELLVADEPTTALDVTVQARILELLQELRAQTGIALLLITHDLGVIAGNCERMLVMHGGRLVEQGATITVFEHPREEVTKAMLAAANPAWSPPARGPAGAANVLRVQDLSVTFHGNGRKQEKLHAVSDITFELAQGETLAIVGESGSGKTTVARAIAGLLPPDRGRIAVMREQLAPRVQERTARQRRQLQMVFQDPVASLNPAMQVGRIIAEAIRLFDADAAAAAGERVIAALRRVGLDESFLQRYPHELSGGQAQRVAIARALVPEPRVLICDEAVSALDGTVRRAILDLLRAEQQRSGVAMIFITHDLSVVRQVSHRVLVMYGGRACELADTEQLFGQPRHPYTRSLLAAAPVNPPRIVHARSRGGMRVGDA